MNLFHEAGYKIATGFFFLVIAFIVFGLCILAASEIGALFFIVIGIGIVTIILSFFIGNLIWYVTDGNL